MVNPGDPVKYSANLENDVRRIVNHAGKTGDGYSQSYSTGKVTIPVYFVQSHSARKAGFVQALKGYPVINGAIPVINIETSSQHVEVHDVLGYVEEPVSFRTDFVDAVVQGIICLKKSQYKSSVDFYGFMMYMRLVFEDEENYYYLIGQNFQNEYFLQRESQPFACYFKINELNEKIIHVNPGYVSINGSNFNMKIQSYEAPVSSLPFTSSAAYGSQPNLLPNQYNNHADISSIQSCYIKIVCFYQIFSDKCEIRMMPFEEEPAWYNNEDEYRQEILCNIFKITKRDKSIQYSLESYFNSFPKFILTGN